MYCRKNIRTTPSPVTTSLSRTEPRDSVTPPPDYTGIAFPTGERSLQGIVRDYPETAILSSESLAVNGSSAEESADPAPLGAEGDEACPSEPILLPPTEDSEEAFSDPAESDPAPPAEENSPKEEPPAAPLINAELLRSLTLEDLMLLWMLLLLLCSEREDQIYLLLGLLLFSER